MLNDSTYNKSRNNPNEFETDGDSSDISNSQSDDDDISSNSSLNILQSQNRHLLRSRYPLKRGNQLESPNQKSTNIPYNPYDFSNPDTLISVKTKSFPEPINILIEKDEPTAQFNSIINSFSDNKLNIYELESSDTQMVMPLDTDFFCTDFFNQAHPLNTKRGIQLPSIDNLYNEMKIKNVKIPPNLLPEVLFDKIISFSDIKVKYIQSFFINIMHNFLTNMIIDVCKGESFLFLRSLISYLSPETQIHHDFPFLITNVLIDVISTLFADKPIVELKTDEAFLQMSKTPEWYPFIHFLSELIIHRQVPYESIRKSIGVFRPSLISEQLIIMITASFLTILPVHETFKICSEIFKDKWLFHAFRNPSSIPMMVLRPDNSQVFPFLYIYGIFSKYFAGEINLNSALSAVNSIGENSIFDSKRILKTFLDPLIEIIYKKYINLSNDAGYLELTKFQRDAINIDLEANLPIFTLCVTNKGVMIALLDRLRILLMRHDYLPKGMTLLLYSFVYNNGVCSPSAFNFWFETVCASKNSQCSSGLLIELNTLVNGSIPSNTSYDNLINLPIPDQISKDLEEVK
ncbi:hypothetical protein M9Y10_033607 [Tritrichomonas musculus]|uniref:Uncharacterized protein n=1 Tax=Tritrichomonas musculus TaxID=1915356 RepID=A0ABR2KDA8_9EUKA